jgi:hypothetical protein
MEPSPAPGTPGRYVADVRYLAVVGALLLVIIASLAGLWIRERVRRVQAENELAQATRKAEGLQIALMRFLVGGQTSAPTATSATTTTAPSNRE